MKPRTITIVAAVLLVLTGVWWIQNHSKVPDNLGSHSLVIAVENDIGSLDPIKIVDNYSLRIGSQVFEGLLTLDAHNELSPRLAEKWESNDDATIWTFHIRSGVKFHPHPCFGEKQTRELTAEDVEFSLTRMISKESTSSFALVNIVQGGIAYQKGEAQTVSGIKVINPLIVEISLISPDPLFVHRITSPWYAIVPKEAVNLGPDKFGLADLPATGPFRLKFHTDNEVTLERSPDYWRPVPGNIKTLTFKTIKNPQFRLNEMRNQRLDIIRLEGDFAAEVTEGSPSKDGSLNLRSDYSKHCLAATYPILNSYFLGFNTERIPLALRQAITKTLNRKQIASIAASPLGQANPSPLPISLRPPALQNQSVSPPSPSLTSQEKNREIEVLVYDKENAERIGELIQAQCAKAGIKIKLTKLDFNAAIGKIIDGSAEAYVINFDYVFSRPELVLSGFFSKDSIPIPNLFRYNSPEASELIKQLASANNPEASLRITQLLEDVIILQAPAAFLFEKRAAVAWRIDLKGVRLTPNNILPFEEIVVP